MAGRSGRETMKLFGRFVINRGFVLMLSSMTAVMSCGPTRAVDAMIPVTFSVVDLRTASPVAHYFEEIWSAEIKETELQWKAAKMDAGGVAAPGFIAYARFSRPGGGLIVSYYMAFGSGCDNGANDKNDHGDVSVCSGKVSSYSGNEYPISRSIGEGCIAVKDSVLAGNGNFGSAQSFAALDASARVIDLSINGVDSSWTAKCAKSVKLLSFE